MKKFCTAASWLCVEIELKVLARGSAWCRKMHFKYKYKYKHKKIWNTIVQIRKHIQTWRTGSRMTVLPSKSQTSTKYKEKNTKYKIQIHIRSVPLTWRTGSRMTVLPSSSPPLWAMWISSPIIYEDDVEMNVSRFAVQYHLNMYIDFEFYVK